MVPETGVEPVRNFVAADFKSATSTNSVIPAPKPMLRTLSGFSERTYEKRKPAASFSLEFWSGRRVSNSRPQPWQGCALPTELLPRRRMRILHRPRTLSSPKIKADTARSARPLKLRQKLPSAFLFGLSRFRRFALLKPRGALTADKAECLRPRKAS